MMDWGSVSSRRSLGQIVLEAAKYSEFKPDFIGVDNVLSSHDKVAEWINRYQFSEATAQSARNNDSGTTKIESQKNASSSTKTETDENTPQQQLQVCHKCKRAFSTARGLNNHISRSHGKFSPNSPLTVRSIESYYKQRLPLKRQRQRVNSVDSSDDFSKKMRTLNLSETESEDDDATVGGQWSKQKPSRTLVSWFPLAQ